MSDWYWRVIALKTAFVLTCLTSYIRAEDTIQKLPFCNPHINNDASATDDLVLVSTLDGRLTAFSTNSGVKAWDIETQPLLSSNLHHVELTSGGKWVRLVPSLRGMLYSLSGDTVEPLPFDADQLLSSSFKYSDDLIIAGARETVWFGVDAATGAVLYSCGTQGCSGEQGGGGRPLLVLRRHSNTVRAVDPRSGNEKWNFSVGEHQVALSSGAECGGAGPAPAGPAAADYALHVALPEGMLVVRQTDSKLLLWQKKLSAPVAGMWRLRSGSLQNIDVLWAATKSLGSETNVQATPPSLYIGSHDSQLYIQEGQLYVQRLETAVTSPARAPWRLRPARALLPGPESATSLQNALATITLYPLNEQKGNQGYFLYHDETCDQAVQVSEDKLNGYPEIPIEITDDHTDHHHIHVHVYSLWFWWKEVLLIAVSSALLMNLMIWPRFFAPKSSELPPTPVHHLTQVYQVHYEHEPPAPAPEYSGRYENDFTPLRCLGRGGFGVVFEARNKIDHRSYAVKRITLPRRESKRERVLREVRALATLEHEHIVRYFNAWLEEPPASWQAQRDALWIRELDGVSVAMTDDASVKSSSYPPPSAAASPRPSRPSSGAGDSVLLNLNKCDLGLDALAGPCKRSRSFSCNDSLSIVFDENATVNTSKGSFKQTGSSGDNDDSFIVFANSHDGDDTTGLSEARRNTGVNKPLERVKECAEYSKADSGYSQKKKKGHTRHWSLDMVVKSTTDDVKTPLDSKMYLYIQMQLCRRDSLHDWLRNNRTYESRGDKVKTLFSQIVSAVEYVHLAGLIHRDLKPSNIFFAPDGKVKVGDFGLVTAMSNSSQDGEDVTDHFQVETRHTYRVGTHLYMSPEQLRGRPYNFKVDIYSLGLILFELLQPFGTEAERVGCLLRLREGRYPDVFHTNYSKETEVLKLMLSADPAQRPTAGGVRERLESTDLRWRLALPALPALAAA